MKNFANKHYNKFNSAIVVQDIVQQIGLFSSPQQNFKNAQVCKDWQIALHSLAWNADQTGYTNLNEYKFTVREQLIKLYQTYLPLAEKILAKKEKNKELRILYLGGKSAQVVKPFFDERTVGLEICTQTINDIKIQIFDMGKVWMRKIDKLLKTIDLVIIAPEDQKDLMHHLTLARNSNPSVFVFVVPDNDVKEDKNQIAPIILNKAKGEVAIKQILSICHRIITLDSYISDELENKTNLKQDPELQKYCTLI